MKCVCVCVFFRALSSNSVFINPIHWLQSVHWAVKSNSSLDKYAAFTHRHTLIFAFHGPQTRLPVPLFFAARSKRVRFTGSKKKKKEKRARKQETKHLFCFLIFTEHLNKTSEPNTKGKLAVSVNDMLFVEHTRATPPNTKQRYKVVIKAKTFPSDTAEALEAWRGYTSQSTRLFVFICV